MLSTVATRIQSRSCRNRHRGRTMWGKRDRRGTVLLRLSSDTGCEEVHWVGSLLLEFGTAFHARYPAIRACLYILQPYMSSWDLKEKKHTHCPWILSVWIANLRIGLSHSPYSINERFFVTSSESWYSNDGPINTYSSHHRFLSQ